MSTRHTSPLSQPARMFFCSSCCQYRNLASFIDIRHNIFTAKCIFCRMRCPVRIPSSSVKGMVTKQLPCIPRKFSIPVVQSPEKEQETLSVVPSVVPQAQWVSVSSKSRDIQCSAYPARYLFHRCLHCLY